MRIKTPLKSTSPPTMLIASVTFDITSRILSRTSRKSITVTFGNCSTRSCWNRARGRIAGTFERRDVGLRRLIERPGPEHEHEPAVTRLAPLDVANARDARADGTAEDVE